MKKNAFISYAHKDKQYFEILIEGLKSHSAQSDNFDWSIWDDRYIVLGYDWEDEIQKAIDKSDFAILLISHNFISSDYCSITELNEFIKRNTHDNFIFIPIFLRDCEYNKLEKVAKKQFFVAIGSDYGFPKVNKMIPYADLIKFDVNNTLIPNSNLDTYHKNLVKSIENSVNKKNKISKTVSNKHKLNDFLPNAKFNSPIHYIIDDNIIRKSFKLDQTILRQHINKLIEIKSKQVEMIGSNDIYPSEIFEEIISSKVIQPATYIEIKSFLDKKGLETFKWYDRSLIVSALTVSLFHSFCEKKMELLIDFINAKENKVWQKALVGLVYSVKRYSNRITEYTTIVNKLITIKNNTELQRKIQFILKDTNRVLKNELVVQIDYNKNPYYDKLYKWFMPFNENIDILNQAFQSTNYNINTNEFANLLTNSASLIKDEKYRVAFAYSRLSLEQVNELINIFKEEKIKFKELEIDYPTDVNNMIFSDLITELILIDKLNPSMKINEIIKEKKSFEDLNFINLIIVDNDKFKLLSSLALIRDDKDSSLKYKIEGVLMEPDSSSKFSKIGYYYQKLDDFKKAVKYHKQAYNLDKESVNTNNDLGFCYLRLNKFNKALEFLKKSNKIEPNNGYTLKQLGFCYQSLNDVGASLDYYLKSEKILNNDTWILIQIGQIYLELSKRNLALDYFLKALELENKNISVIFSLGWYYFTSNEMKRAKHWFDKILEIDKNYKSPNLFMNLGHIELCDENKTTAIELYKKGIELSNDKDDFIKGMKSDWLYVKNCNVEQTEYDEIIKNLL